MRNLKRVLSLVMAVAMLIGLMVVSANAASTYDNFTDKDEIVNKEAVNTMVSLGVINGKEDGSYFAPADIVTRAEMAKLIAVTLNGGKDPLLGTGAAVSPFTDVASNYWAAPYIAYCANLGIINGKGDGTFGPEEAVTGTAAAKMMLTALGYRSDIEGLTGSGWDLNTDSLANKVGLYDDMSIVPSNGLSRDNTAQLLYNGVQADEVVYRNNYGEYSGVIYAQPVNGTGAGAESSTVLHTRFNVDKVEGVVVSTDLYTMNKATWGTTVEGKTRLDNITVNGDAPGTTTDIYPVDIDDSLLGQKVVLYVKGLKDLAPNASSTEVVSEPIVSQDNTVVTTTGRLAKASNVKDALKGSGVAMPAGGTASVVISENVTTTPTDYTGTQAMPGVTQTFIDNNGDGTVDVVIAKNPALAKINTYNKSTEAMNISGVGAVDFVDVVNPEDVAQGDYVLVYNYDGGYVLEQVETVSGVVSVYTNNATVPALSTITIDGTKYGQGSGKNLAPDVQTLTDIPGTMQEMLDGTYTLYLDPNGNILGYVEDQGVIGNYAVITGVNSTGSTAGFYAAEIKAILADGTTGKYDVNLLASANKFGFTGTNADKEKAMYDAVMGMKDTLVAYALDGSTITLIDAEASTENYEYDVDAAGDGMNLRNSNAEYIFDNDGRLMADNKTAFFIKDGKGNYSVVSGLSNLPANALTSTSAQAIYYAPTKTAKAIFAVVTEDFTSNSSFAFIYNNYSAKTEGTDTIYTYPVVLEDGTISTLSSKTDKGVSKTAVHEYQVSGNYVTFDNQTGDIRNKLMVETVGNGTITVVDADTNAPVGSFPVLASAKIWNVEDVKADNADSVFATSFQKYDKVALVLDVNGNVKTGYVYDRQDGVMTAAPTVTYAGDATFVDADGAGATLGAASATVYWNDAAVDEEIKLTVTPDANQDVKVTVTKDSKAAGVASTAATLDPAKGIGLANELLYTTNDTVLENGGKVTVTITVSEAGYAARTIVHTIYVSAEKATEPTVTLAGATATLEDGEVAEATIDNAVIGTAAIAFNVVDNGGTSTAKLNGAAYTSNTAVMVAAGETTYTLEVEVTESNKLTTTYTYTLDLTVNQAATSEATVKIATGDDGTNDLTVSSSPATLTANDATTVTVTSYNESTANTVQIDMTGATVKSATLQAPDGSMSSVSNGDEFVVTKAAESGGNSTYILTVVTQDEGKTATTTKRFFLDGYFGPCGCRFRPDKTQAPQTIQSS